MKQYYLALDLVDDEEKIAAYEAHHDKIWPEIVQSIKASGIEEMAIYRFGNRLFMTISASDDFSFEKKAAADAMDEKVQEWEKLMWEYQQAIPGSKPGEKWVVLKEIFRIN